MLKGYARNSSLDDAVSFFCRMRLVEEAYKMFDRMPERDLEEGKRPDSITVVSILPAVADMGSLRIGRSIHGYSMRAGFESFVNVSTALVDMYSKCGSVGTARLIFDRMTGKTVVSWNSMIDGGNDQCYRYGALHACADLGDVEQGRVDIAAEIFENLQHKTLVSWNAMILGYAQNGRIKEAIDYFCKMQLQKIKPDSFTMVSVIPALAELSVLPQAKWIHGLVMRTCLDKNVFVATALVDMYAKCGAVHTARKLFDMMDERHVTTWNAMIDGLQSSGLVEEGFQYFGSMKKDYGLEPAMDHYGAMVDLLGRANRLNEAWDFIQKMPIEPAISVFGAMLGLAGFTKMLSWGRRQQTEYLT
ncbi:Pentatricopeptide repeat-containing protein, chloroplastic [Vitis vinifera]|uniref:Pentatricopeptide repeat-containing protein, chloroplastic n=1 Tax=Vitis vinifera TaxID=29760 RepID=A0A438DMZ6_VITVI|nr:Pentatricopeptide repeat-containing protein, chloroplastic [Vitis vinifera]